MKKILITGANGFLGTHVVRAFNNTLVLTPKSSELNLLNFDDLSKYLHDNAPSHVLHMAAKCGGILANKNSPADFLRDNTQMALNIYEASRVNNIKSVYSIGTVCAYPKYCPVPFKENNIWDGLPEETNAPYAQAKRTLLMLHQTYRAQYGFKGAYLIPVNLFGPYDHFDLINGHVIPALIRKFIEAKENNSKYVECWGTGIGATREFLYAEDAAQIITKTVLSDFDHPDPINLGTGKDITIKDLANLIKELTDYKGEIVFTGEVSDGQPQRRLDVTKARHLLKWTAPTELIDGLRKTIEWYWSNR